MNLSIPNKTTVNQPPHEYTSVSNLLGKPGKSKTRYGFNRSNPYNYSQKHGPNPNPNSNRDTLEKIHERYNKNSPYLAELYKPNIKKGGGPLPLRYFDVNADHPSADPGCNMRISGNVVRPAIGGKRSTRNRRTRRTRRSNKTKRTRTKGGFFPSIMEPFVLGCSKYIAPLAGLSAWKLMNRPTKRLSKRSSKKSLAKSSKKTF
jgi:hypothetical protein